MVRNGRFLKNAELYDPASRSFSPTAEMSLERVGHAAVRLKSGAVLIAGGWTSVGPADGAELYDPLTGRFALLSARMTVRRARPSATLLKDGRVLLAGGADADVPGSRLKSGEIFDPEAKTFSAVGLMSDGRISHTATLLNDGRVLIAGGRDFDKGVVSSAEIFDPRTGRFSRTGSLTQPRYKQTAALLGDGRVLVAGGSDDRDWRGSLSSAEIFDPRAGLWSPAPHMVEKRFKLPEEAARLASGDILVAGGAQRAEIYDPRANRFTAVAGGTDRARHFMSETLLATGEVLLAGGYPDSDEATEKTWLVRLVR
jgi:hypothetical protein